MPNSPALAIPPRCHGLYLAGSVPTNVHGPPGPCTVLRFCTPCTCCTSVVRPVAWSVYVASDRADVDITTAPSGSSPPAPPVLFRARSVFLKRWRMTGRRPTTCAHERVDRPASSPWRFNVPVPPLPRQRGARPPFLDPLMAFNFAPRTHAVACCRTWQHRITVG